MICAGFPPALREDVEIALNAAATARHEPHPDDSYRAIVAGNAVTVPYRVYFPAVSQDDIGHLSPRQRIIFASFMTRHHDGHQREYWARVLCSHPADWTAPYLSFLLGDYVIEVLSATNQCLTPDWTPIMSQFAEANHLHIRSLNHRILSYWSLYYRYFGPGIRKMTDYPGYTIAHKLGLWDPRTAPRLLRKAMANKTR